MAIRQKYEQAIKSSWIYALGQSADITAIVSTRIKYAWDQSVTFAPPCIVVRPWSIRPESHRGDKYYLAKVDLLVVTSMDDDPSCSTRDSLLGAIRDVFDGSGVMSTLDTGATSLGLHMRGLEQTDPPDYDYAAEERVNIATITYDIYADMIPTA